jgi:hypothetical protein
MAVRTRKEHRIFRLQNFGINKQDISKVIAGFIDIFSNARLPPEQTICTLCMEFEESVSIFVLKRP